MADGLDAATDLLVRCGAPLDAVLRLEMGADLVRYWDLGAPRRGEPRLVDLVVENARQPLLFVKVGTLDKAALARLARAVALRGDGSRVAVYSAGSLILLDGALKPRKPKVSKQVSSSAPDPWFIPSLLDGREMPDASASRRVIFDLLRGVTDAIMKRRVAGYGTLSADDALSLAGRALFVRFLFDRGIVGDADVQSIAPRARRVEDLFADGRNAHATSRWLTTTFNGDLLPLPHGGVKDWFEALPAAVFDRLSDVMLRAPGGQLSLPLGWDGIDFAHVPVGLLSEVYEAHSAEHDSKRATATSMHYTPRTIASMMVSQSLASLAKPWEARVLDPAAGAGVFLVEAYRQLVEARWRHDKKRPTRATLRRILNKQLKGFDIHERALRLSALSLYLTALELDPSPTPPEALTFDCLRGSVLVHVGDEDAHGAIDDDDPPAGSLGEVGDVAPGDRFDVVVGNPPWTAWKKRLPHGVQDRVDRAFQARGGVGGAKLHDLSPDVAFLWRATEWVREGGQIAFAMSASLLFQQSDGGAQMRREVFEGLRVTGVVNGAALRNTGYWPNITAPFCLMFAVNERPPAGSAFWFVNPNLDPDFNDRGRVRVDVDTTRMVSTRSVLNDPRRLKMYFRGNDADRALMARLGDLPTLSTWWVSVLGLHADHQGYQVGKKAGKQKDASEFHGLADLRKRRGDRRRPRFRVDRETLPEFKRPTLLRPRVRALYSRPLVIVPESIPVDRMLGRAALALERDVMFSESFHGWSCAEAKEPELLARYLFLVFNSNMPRYVALMTSAKYGVERDVVLLEDLARLPVRPLDQLPETLRARIALLSENLADGPLRDWDALDRWIADVYELDADDQQTLRDALDVAAPESPSRARAIARVTSVQRDAWAARVVDVVNPFIVPYGFAVKAERIPAPEMLWEALRFRRVSATEATSTVGVATGAPADLGRLFAHADALSASEVQIIEADGSIVVARLCHYRYWTLTRARLFGAALVQQHGDALAGLS